MGEQDRTGTEDTPGTDAVALRTDCVFEPVMPKDVIKVITEEGIPPGAMMFHLVRNATPEDRKFIRETIEKTEADLEAMKTIEAALGARFARLPAPVPETSVKMRKPRKPRQARRVRTVAAPKPARTPISPIDRPFRPEDDPQMDAIDQEYDTKKKPLGPPATRRTTRAAKEPILTDAQATAADTVRTASGRDAVRTERRQKIIQYLWHGPKFPMEIVGQVGIPQGSISAVLDCDWFQRTPVNAVELTAKGRAARED